MRCVYFLGNLFCIKIAYFVHTLWFFYFSCSFLSVLYFFNRLLYIMRIKISKLIKIELEYITDSL